MTRRPRAVEYRTENSFAADNDSSEFVRREVNYPLIDERDAVNIDWESDLEKRRYRGRVPREGYDQSSPVVKVRIPNWDVTIDKPTTPVPQTSYVPTIMIIFPTNNTSIAAGSTLTVKATAEEYPYAAELHINDIIVLRRDVPDSDKGQQNQVFMFDYNVPDDLAGQQMIVKVAVRGAKNNCAGKLAWKPASTGSIEAKKRGIWESYGNLTVFDQSVYGYEPPTDPDFLFIEPDDTDSVVINVT